MKKIALIIAALSLFSVFVVGCAQDSGSGGDAAKPAAEGGDAAKTEESK
jgi:predicted small secreted protein